MSESSEPSRTVVVIDDDPSCLRLVQEAVEQCGYAQSGFGSVTEFLKAIRPGTNDHAPLVIIADIMMPEADGIDLMRALARRQVETPIILISSQSRHYLQAAERLGAAWGLKVAAALPKPVSARGLSRVLEGLSKEHTTSP